MVMVFKTVKAGMGVGVSVAKVGKKAISPPPEMPDLRVTPREVLIISHLHFHFFIPGKDEVEVIVHGLAQHGGMVVIRKGVSFFG